MSKIYKQLSELGNIVTGKTPSTANNELWGGNIPFITPTDIKGYDTYYQEITERTISENGASKQKNTLLPPNSICVTCIGSTIGKPCITKNTSISNQQINSIIPNKDNDFRYIYYIIREGLPYFQLIGGGSGSGTPIISKNKFAKIKFPIETDLQTQRKIASILSSYDSLIENNTKRIRLLEQIAENLYKEWFVRFRFPGHENTEFVDGLPKGWAIIRIKKLTSLKSGFAFKSEWFTNEGYAVAKIKDIGNIIMDTSDFSYVYEENCKKAERYKLVEGDLTIALTGATIGKISIVPKYNKPLYTNQRLGKFFNGANPIDKLPFLYCLFSQDVMIQNIINLANSSSAQPNISPEQIENIKFIGNLRLIDIFNKAAKNLFKEILNLHYQSALLTRQRDLLLPRLMSGKLEVKAIKE